MKKKLTYIIGLLLFVGIVGCSDLLKEEPFSQLAPESILNSEEGVNSVLFGAYGEAGFLLRTPNQRLLEQWTTDHEWSTGGWINRNFQLLTAFTWSPELELIPDAYNQGYSTIRDANIIIDNADNIDESIRALYVAEARFIRAWMYERLYDLFGPVPIRLSNADPVEQSRPGEDEFKSFVENEFLQIVPDLPNPGEEASYGRANKGAAMGILCKFYLNTKQWQKSADIADQLIKLNYYELFPNCVDLFKVENNGNKESVWELLSNPQDPATNSGCTYMNGWFPPTDFVEAPELGIKWQNNWTSWAVHYRLRDDFYNSFEYGDQRKKLIITKYINKSGKTIQLLGADNTRSFKFWPDPNAIGFNHGNNIPYIRYADILLSYAEALNEINGPNQKSLDLINQVRNRAGLDNLLLSNFSSKDLLRDHILDERGWEFFGEKMRRQDLIRHNKFVKYALARGATNAQEYHKRFPIPQSVIDSNPKLEQNPGY